MNPPEERNDVNPRINSRDNSGVWRDMATSRDSQNTSEPDEKADRPVEVQGSPIRAQSSRERPKPQEPLKSQRKAPKNLRESWRLIKGSYGDECGIRSPLNLLPPEPSRACRIFHSGGEFHSSRAFDSDRARNKLAAWILFEGRIAAVEALQRIALEVLDGKFLRDKRQDAGSKVTRIDPGICILTPAIGKRRRPSSHTVGDSVSRLQEQADEIPFGCAPWNTLPPSALKAQCFFRSGVATHRERLAVAEELLDTCNELLCSLRSNRFQCSSLNSPLSPQLGEFNSEDGPSRAFWTRVRRSPSLSLLAQRSQLIRGLVDRLDGFTLRRSSENSVNGSRRRDDLFDHLFRMRGSSIRATICVQEANWLCHNGEFLAAIKTNERALRLSPLRVDAAFNRWMLSKELQNHSVAEKCRRDFARIWDRQRWSATARLRVAESTLAVWNVWHDKATNTRRFGLEVFSAKFG